MSCEFTRKAVMKFLPAGAPNGSVPQNICSSATFLLAGRCGRNNSPRKESVAGKKIIHWVRGDLKSRIAAMGHLYGLLTTQNLNCTLWNFPVSQVAGCKFAGWELFHQSCWEWGTDNFFQQSPKMLKIVSENFIHALLLFLGLFLKISRWVPLYQLSFPEFTMARRIKVQYWFLTVQLWFYTV